MAVEGVLDGVPNGALWLLVELLVRFKSMSLQTEALAARRALVVEDDARQLGSLEPSARRNRELLMSLEVYPRVKEVLKEAKSLAFKPGEGD